MFFRLSLGAGLIAATVVIQALLMTVATALIMAVIQRLYFTK
jgi:hypothetical protein